MKSKATLVLAVMLMALPTIAQTTVTQTSLDQTIANWPAKPAEAVRTLVAKYGLPQEVTASQVMWHNNGPWKHTKVFREEVPHEFPAPHTDFLQQTIAYRVPTDRFDDLAAYDGSVIAERTKGELSARCDKEELNFLALNLANDVARGTKTVEEARRFYADTAMAFKKGELRPYTRGLQFSAPTTLAAADPDMMFNPAQPMTSSSSVDPNNVDDVNDAATRQRMSKD